uniref:Olfactory receptor family 56 subfamily B member 1 n=1 Tax=Rhinopithecus roxellana TaxID=61622 RepID=A0A2K6P8A9_RHIRO
MNHMSASLKVSNSSKFQVSEFILLGFPGIHSWQYWLSLPLALLYLSALAANTLILLIIWQNPSLQQPMYPFLGILSVVDVGLATTITPKNLAIFWFDAKVISLPDLACDDRRPNSICQLVLAWLGMGSDLSLIILSYILILYSVLRLNSVEAAAKDLSTCSSHLTLILFFYTIVVVISVTHLTDMRATLIPVLLNVLHNIILPSLNPIVYALQTKELRAAFQKVLFALTKEIRS